MAFSQTRNQIINRALRIVGVVGDGNTATASQIANGAIALSGILETLYAEDIRFWETEWKTKTFSGSSEVIGSDTKNYRCIMPHTAAASNYPVTGADYTTYWTAGGSSGVAWVSGTAYTSNGVFSLSDLDSKAYDIISANIRSGGYDNPVKVIDKYEYSNITDKAEDGEPMSLWVQKNISATRGTCYLWPQTDDNTDVLHCLTILLPDTDIAAGVAPDFPRHWTDALTLMTANNLAWEYQLPVDDRTFLSNKADKAKALATSIDKPKTGYERMPAIY